MSTKEKFYVRASAYCVLLKDNKVFLLRRANTGWADGQFAFPAGHIKEFETPRSAAVRELKEEAGVDAKIEDLKFAHALYRRSNIDVYADYIFVVEKWSGEPYNAEPTKADYGDWFDLEKLPGNTAPHIVHILENIRAGNFYSEFGWS